jgi:protein SCO1
VDAGIRNTLIGLVGFIALVLGLFLYSFLSARTYSDEEYRALGFYRFPVPRNIDGFALVDELGTAVDGDNLRGKWSLLFFGYTSCPDICPTTMGVLARVVEKVQHPPQVILVTVDPEHDQPEQLARYVHAFNPAFVGYTGSFDELVKLATNLNIAFGKVPGTTPGTYLVDHAASLVVVNPDGKYAGFIKPPLNAQSIEKIVQSLR